MASVVDVEDVLSRDGSKEVLLGVDVESAGPQPLRHPVVAVGFSVGIYHPGDKVYAEVDRRRFAFTVSLNEFDSVCMNDFWDKQDPANFRALVLGLDPACRPWPREYGWHQVASYIDSLERHPHLSGGHPWLILTDQPGFDMTFITVNLDRYANRLPLNYDSTGKWGRRTIDTNLVRETSRVPSVSKVELSRLHAGVRHSHLPEEDARWHLANFTHYDSRHLRPK